MNYLVKMVEKKYTKKLEWYGKITLLTDKDKDWLHFANQEYAGYEYNSDMTEITASTDDRNGNITDKIYFAAEKNETSIPRHATVEFTQKCDSSGHTCTLNITQKGDELYNFFENNQMITMVYDEGILRKNGALPNKHLSSINLFRSENKGFYYKENIDKIYIAKPDLTVEEIIPDTDKNFVKNGDYYYYNNDYNHYVNNNKIIIFLKLKSDTIPHEMEYKNGNVTTVKFPTPYDKLDNACFYHNDNLETVFLGKAIKTLISDCLANMSRIKNIYIAAPNAPELKTDKSPGYTFIGTVEKNNVPKNCIIYGVKGSNMSYNVSDTCPWNWPGCIRTQAFQNPKCSSDTQMISYTPQGNISNIDTWTIDTSWYTAEQETKVFKETVIDRDTTSS